MKKKQVFQVVLLLLFAFVLRFYKVDQIPASLYYDEVDYGYQARSIIETGKDYRGSFSPFYVHSFNDIRAPMPAYLTVLTTLAFKTPELQVRMPSVISGTLIVLLVFYLILVWTRSFYKAILIALVFATSPWQIQYSRFSHEVSSMLLFFLSGILFFFLSLDTRKFIHLLSFAILLSLTVYTYRTMSFFAPLTLLVILIIYFSKLKEFGFKKLFLAGVVCAFLILPFLYFTTVKAPDQPRINQLAVFADPQIPIWVQRNREVDSNDFNDKTIGKSASKVSFVFHNKVLSWLDSFINNYFKNFSTEFLLIEGDPNKRHSIGQMGEIFFIDIIPLLIGLFFVFKNLKDKKMQFLLSMLLLTPIPAAITTDGAKHASRLFIFSAPLLITIGFGWIKLIEIFKNTKFKKITYLFLFSLWSLLFIFYLHRYFVHYPIESARSFGFGFKQAMQKITKEDKNFKKIAMVPTKDPPMIYYLFWSNTSPKKLQEYGTDFSESTKLSKTLDKYKVIDWPGERAKDPKVAGLLEDNVLYLLTQLELAADLRDKSNLPEGIKLIDLVLYPDNEIAFYLITKDTNATF